MSDIIRSDGDSEQPQRNRQKKDKRQRSGSKQRSAPDSDACLAALGQLPGLVAMRVLTTAQVNTMRGVYSTMLQQHHRSQAGQHQAQLDDADVMAILRDNPTLLSLLEPLLTDEQIDAIMDDSEGATDGQA
jgi:hypothetical protein